MECLVYTSDKLLQALETATSKLAQFGSISRPWNNSGFFFLELLSSVTVILLRFLCSGFINEFIFP